MARNTDEPCTAGQRGDDNTLLLGVLLQELLALGIGGSRDGRARHKHGENQTGHGGENGEGDVSSYQAVCISQCYVLSGLLLATVRLRLHTLIAPGQHGRLHPLQ
jgi:hypothetical protein